MPLKGEGLDMSLLHRVHEEYREKSDVNFAWLEVALEDHWCFALRVRQTRSSGRGSVYSLKCR